MFHICKVSNADSGYHTTLFRLCNKIKENFSMSEKVRVTEDALRSNFLLWIALAIEKRKELHAGMGNLVLIIDGVDKFVDESGKEDSSDWMPTEFPPNVRVIYSCARNSRAYDHLSAQSDLIVFMNSLSIQSIKGKSHTFSNEFPALHSDLAGFPMCGNPLYLSLLLSFIHTNVADVRRFKYPDLNSFLSIKALASHFLDYYTDKEFKSETLSKFFWPMIISRSGLSIEELRTFTKSTTFTIQNLLQVFSPFLHNSQGYYIVKHEIFTRLIMEKFPINTDPLRGQMIENLNDNKFTLRKVDELLHHLYESKKWMQLKDLLTRLEVFVIMYSSICKIDLYMYWIKLVEQHFDPVCEYNKSLEDFVVHFSPKNKDLFVLLVQFCRFFKDMAEVELKFACCFRHPRFLGFYELRDIDLWEEIESLPGMFESNQSAGYEDEAILREIQSSENCQVDVIELDRVKSKNPEFYYYKRWLWMQFPWFTIDKSSNFSLSMKNFSYFADSISAQEDLNIFLNIVKLVTFKTPEVKKRLTLKVSISQPLHKSVHELFNFPDIKPQGFILPQKSLKTKKRRFLSTSLKVARLESREYNLDLTFKELSPGNILQKVGSQVINYTNHELVCQRKQTFELQKTFNKYRDELRSRTSQLAALQSRIAKSLDEIKTNEENQEKIIKVQEKIEKTFYKYQALEVEGKRLEKIVTCCIKNPTHNEKWEKSLEKLLESIKNITKLEVSAIKAYKKEGFLFKEQSKIFQTIKEQKALVQQKTIKRAETQLQVKSKVKRNMLNGYNRRCKITQQGKRFNVVNHIALMDQNYENAIEKIDDYKKFVKQKLGYYKELVKKLSVFRTFEDVYSLSEIISTFQMNSNLREDVVGKRKMIEEVAREKEALDFKLSFFKEKKQKELEKPGKFKDLDEVTRCISQADKRFEIAESSVDLQSGVLLKIKNFIENFWNGLMINQKLVNADENILENFNLIKERILEFDTIAEGSKFSRYEYNCSPELHKPTSRASEYFTYKSTNTEF